MKFKFLKITNIAARQIIMCESSEKETVLYAEEFESNSDENNEFVIGLPLAVREWNQNNINDLAQRIREVFMKHYQHEDFAVAIHNKNLDDEVHFHLSYKYEPLDPRVIEAEFLNFKI